MSYRLFLAPALVLLCSTGCSVVALPNMTDDRADDPEQVDETGPDSAPALRATFRTAGVGLRGASTLVLDRLDVWVDEVVFDADAPDETIEIEDTVRTKVDALSGSADPDVVGIQLDPGCYGSPYLGVEMWDEGPEPALVLEGSLDGVPIRFVFDSAEVFEAESDSVLVADGTVQDVTFTLDPQRWFNRVDASRLALGNDGVAEISETMNAAVFDRVADELDKTTDGRFPRDASCKKWTSSKTTDTGW